MPALLQQRPAPSGGLLHPREHASPQGQGPEPDAPGDDATEEDGLRRTRPGVHLAVHCAGGRVGLAWYEEASGEVRYLTTLWRCSENALRC